MHLFGCLRIRIQRGREREIERDMYTYVHMYICIHVFFLHALHTAVDYGPYIHIYIYTYEGPHIGSM